ncbi:MAG: 23S rRNA (uracil(1939)-C(5))-methyltransferase RlmD [Bacteroidales bacterium]|nr:23S rRNA (uracil(1939)-C(5))-methyltransferase RlmD [Bacteroidales bacterium]
MSRSNKRHFFNKVIENITIAGVAGEGKAIARHNDMVIFVNYGAPGDVVDIQIKKTRRRHMEGEIIRYHEKSASRTEPFCEHFGICGGCKWQHLSYDEQLRYKQKQVTDNLERIGKVNYPFDLIPILGSEQTQFYRNKLEYTFASRRWLTPDEIQSGEEISNPEALGYHIPGFYDKVLDIKKCWLQPEPSNHIRLGIKEFAIKNNINFFDFRTKSGLLRNIIIRNNEKGEFMLILVLFSGEEENRERLLNFAQQNFPEIISIHYMINDKQNSSIADLEPVHFAGKPYLTEEMEGLKFKIGPKSFYQTNSRQAYELYKVARDFAGLKGSEMVYDLYTGTGTIANFVARQVKKVAGIEYIEEAVIHARENSAINGLDNLVFESGDMAKVLTPEFMERHGKPDVIITDPPRAGMHPDVLKQIKASEAKKIVYVSCNPATQARDIEILSDSYRVKKVQAVDMFPHTQHVESVVLLDYEPQRHEGAE